MDIQLLLKKPEYQSAIEELCKLIPQEALHKIIDDSILYRQKQTDADFQQFTKGQVPKNVIKQQQKISNSSRYQTTGLPWYGKILIRYYSWIAKQQVIANAKQAIALTQQPEFWIKEKDELTQIIPRLLIQGWLEALFKIEIPTSSLYLDLTDDLLPEIYPIDNTHNWKQYCIRHLTEHLPGVDSVILFEQFIESAKTELKHTDLLLIRNRRIVITSQNKPRLVLRHATSE